MADGITLAAGDRVCLEFVPAELVRAAWFAYGLPLAGLVVAAIVATRLWPAHELAAVLCAALGLVAGAAYGRRALLRSGCLSRCVPVVSGKLDPKRP